MSEGRYQSHANVERLLDDIDWLHDRLDNMADTILAYRLTLGEELQDSEWAERITTACEVMLEEDDYQVINYRYEFFDAEKRAPADTSDDLRTDLGLIEDDEGEEHVLDDGC